ncbi:hypothetical protein WDW86_11205 [Bdellovibrionota bacterium FG-2]
MVLENLFLLALAITSVAQAVPPKTGLETFLACGKITEPQKLGSCADPWISPELPEETRVKIFAWLEKTGRHRSVSACSTAQIRLIKIAGVAASEDVLCLRHIDAPYAAAARDPKENWGFVIYRKTAEGIRIVKVKD